MWFLQPLASRLSRKWSSWRKLCVLQHLACQGESDVIAFRDWAEVLYWGLLTWYTLGINLSLVWLISLW